MDTGDDRSRWKAYVLQQLSPRVLLLNMANARVRTPDCKYFKIGVAYRMAGQAERLQSFGAEARAIEDELVADRGIANRLAALRAMGFEVYFEIYDEPWRRDLEINVIQNADAERLLKIEADKTS
ncbi:MAG: hypothetical protein E7773_07375 [Sphingomonas sp.]|uniref:hypothetical protein n=1 Tax=Sphingomonas sp. TaxID=28214 RepID=UPI001206FE63|nr:hypothetical protein [Sphingomonas sp.]THD36810.1 MAG: hypothetical protein E7773_07375 [Sphingomonas sp.]